MEVTKVIGKKRVTLYIRSLHTLYYTTTTYVYETQDFNHARCLMYSNYSAVRSTKNVINECIHVYLNGGT